MGRYNGYHGQRNYQRRENFGGRQSSYDTDYSYNAVKKSGAFYSRIKTGKNEGLYCVNAWRKTRNGLMKASAFPAGQEEFKSESGNTYLKYVVEIVNLDMGTTQTYWCLYNISTRKIFIKELGLVISPNGSGVTRGGQRVSGYFGKAYGK